jgi:hypothetical protein
LDDVAGNIRSGRPCIAGDEVSFAQRMNVAARAHGGQGLTHVHFPAQPEPFLTQNAPQSPPNNP